MNMVTKGGISQEQQYGMWYYQGLRTCGEETFPVIFHKTYLGGSSTIKHHIFSILEDHDQKGQSKKPLTDKKKERLYKKQFYEYQRQMLEGQIPLEDITLLYKLLYNSKICDLATDDSAWTDESSKLEYGIHFIKCERDKFSHESLELSEKGYTERLEYLTKVVKAMLLEAGRRFNADFSQLSTTVCQKLKAIQETNIINNLNPSNTDHWQMLKNIIKLRQEHQERDTLDRIRQEITVPYEDLCQVQPAPWLLRDDHKAKPPEIFVSMELKQENNMRNMGRTKIIVKHNQIVSVKTPEGGDPTVVILLGEGGAGKSTLMKLVIHHWLDRTDEIKGLLSFPLLLFTECRDTTKESINDLLQHYCPRTVSFYGCDRLKEIVFSQPLIIIVDGYDEINPSSKKLLKEILSYNGEHIRTFLTTRPINARELTKTVPETKVKLTLEVLGIVEEHQSLFIMKLLRVLLDDSQKIQEEKDKLMKHLSNMTGEMHSLLHNPLNLSLMVLMWIESPEKINSLTSMTALFTAFRELTTGKVTERLMKRGFVHTKANEICQLFLQIFDELAFDTHCRGEFELKTETINDLKRKTRDMEISDETEEDFLSSYFITKLSRKLFRLIRIYNFRHRLEQQYACANHLAALATQPAAQMTLKQIIEKKYWESNVEESEDISNLGIKFKEVLIFITGILWREKVLHTFSKDIISLVYVEPDDKGQVELDALLHHLAECNMDASVLQAVQERLNYWYKEGIHAWRINSGKHLHSLPPLLSSTTVEKILLNIPENPATLTHLHPALEDVVKKTIKVNLHIGYNRSGFPIKKCVEDATLGVFSKSMVLETYWGFISGAGARLLPESLTQLDLDVGVDHIPHLNTRLPTLPNLNNVLLWISLRQLPEPARVSRLQYLGEKLFIWLCYPGLEDDQAPTMATVLANMWPAARPRLRRDLGNIWATDLTVAGIEKLVKSLGCSGSAEHRSKRRTTSLPYMIKRQKLEARQGDDSDQKGSGSSDADGGNAGNNVGIDARPGESGDASGSDNKNSVPAYVDRLWMSSSLLLSQEEQQYLETVARSYGIVELVVHNK